MYNGNNKMHQIIVTLILTRIKQCKYFSSEVCRLVDIEKITEMWSY